MRIILSHARARFIEGAGGRFVSEAVDTVVSAGVSVDGRRHLFGSARLRYFGPRALIEDNSMRSEATTLVNLQGGWRVARNLRVTADVFNLLNSESSDIDYYFTSGPRLQRQNRA